MSAGESLHYVHELHPTAVLVTAVCVPLAFENY